MATIGTFTKNENGAGFTGAVKTLTLNVKAKFSAARSCPKHPRQHRHRRRIGAKPRFSSCSRPTRARPRHRAIPAMRSRRTAA